MGKSVLLELMQLRDEALGKTHADEPWYVRLEHVYKELAEFVGAVISATDDENRVADLAQLQADVQVVARQTADILLVKNPWLLGVAQGVITAGSTALTPLIAKHTENLDEVVEENVLPPLVHLRDLIDHTITQLEGDRHDNPDHVHDEDEDDECE